MRERIIKLKEKFRQAMLAKDVKTLGKLIHETIKMIDGK